MTLTIAYSGASAPSAFLLKETLGDACTLVRDSSTPVDINWGRAVANATLNANTSVVTDKRYMRNLFAAEGVPTPKLYPLDAIELPAIGRPDRHTRGKGLWRVNSAAEVQAALRGRQYRNGTRKAAATHFMELITPDRAPHEFRVHVFMGKVIRLSRKAFDGTATGNHRSYETVSAAGMELSHIRKAAKLALAAVALDFGAVDILASDTEAFVLEVNSAPGLGGSMPALYAAKFTSWKEAQV